MARSLGATTGSNLSLAGAATWTLYVSYPVTLTSLTVSTTATGLVTLAVDSVSVASSASGASGDRVLTLGTPLVLNPGAHTFAVTYTPTASTFRGSTVRPFGLDVLNPTTLVQSPTNYPYVIYTFDDLTAFTTGEPLLPVFLLGEPSTGDCPMPTSGRLYPLRG